MNDHAVLAAVLRIDLRFFIWKCFQTILPGTPYQRNWHVDAIVHQLMRVQAGDIPRLLITPRTLPLKSICVPVACVAWLLAHDPPRRIIVVSYSNEFAAELHRQFRMVIDAPWYRALFPAMRPAKDSGTEFVTSRRGGCGSSFFKSLVRPQAPAGAILGSQLIGSADFLSVCKSREPDIGIAHS